MNSPGERVSPGRAVGERHGLSRRPRRPGGDYLARRASDCRGLLGVQLLLPVRNAQSNDRGSGLADCHELSRLLHRNQPEDHGGDDRFDVGGRPKSLGLPLVPQGCGQRLVAQTRTDGLAAGRRHGGRPNLQPVQSQPQLPRFELQSRCWSLVHLMTGFGGHWNAFLYRSGRYIPQYRGRDRNPYLR